MLQLPGKDILFELHVFTGLDPFLSPNSQFADCKANLLHTIVEPVTATGVSDPSRALYLAWDEQRSSNSFEKRHAYAKFLWKDWEESSEKIGRDWKAPNWTRILTPKQRREFQSITSEIALALEEMRTQGEEMDDVYEALSRIFPTGSPNTYRPLRLPKARGGNHINHPSPFFTDEEFESPKEALLGGVKWDGTEARAAKTRTTESENITTMDLEDLRIDDYHTRGRQSEARETMLDALRNIPDAISHMADMSIVDSGGEEEAEFEEDKDVDMLLEEGVGDAEDDLSDPEVDGGNESGGEEYGEEGASRQLSGSEGETSESDSDEDPYDIDGTTGLIGEAARCR